METTRVVRSTTVSPSVSLVLAAALASCSTLATSQTEGPAEKAGQQIDRTVEKAGEATADMRKSASEKTQSTGEYMEDSAITAKVKLGILRDPELKVLQISVTTTDGVVNLSGVVDSQQSVDRAIEVARGIGNVKSVESSLTAKDAR
jgi:hyperosmotically inducible periplasmic protein